MSENPLIRAATEPVGPLPAASQTSPAKQSRSDQFAQALADASRKLQFSKHALARLQRRGIPFGPAELQRLEVGVQRAAEKGARDSVVVVDGTVFVVSVANRTVLTAVPHKQQAPQVFTNVDSAVLA
jgi:flagellar operon protein